MFTEKTIMNALCFDIDDLAYSLRIVNGNASPHRYLVEKETYNLLDFLSLQKIAATMFVPGYVARLFPALIRSMSSSGHEVAAHGYTHQIEELTDRKKFRIDARRVKSVLEDILSAEISAYKAPMWEITPRTLWAYDELIEAGYRVDNTARPILLKTLGRHPGDMTPFTFKKSLTIIPVTSKKIFHRIVPFNGGYYSAYIPISLQVRYYKRLNEKGISFNYFCHPYESHPEGINKTAWKYHSLRAGFYGAHFGRYRRYITKLLGQFSFGPLKTTYKKYLTGSCPA